MADIISTSENIRVEVADNILTIQLQRPEKKNALNLDMYRALGKVLSAAADNDDVRVILFTGGAECFCSGNDLREFVELDDDAEKHAVLEEHNPLLGFMRELLYCNKPVVAAVSGPAIGIGATLLLHCDFVYLADEAYLHYPFANLGLVPEFAASWLLPQHLGCQRTAQCLLLGEVIGAQQAREWGLVTQVLDRAELLEQAMATCRRLAQSPAGALRATKHLLKVNIRERAAVVMENERRYFVRRLQSAEFIDVANAFLKR